MEENKQHIDDLFREALGNYTETPPPAVWAAVAQRLDADKRKPKGGLVWWGWIVLLLLTIGGGALIYNAQRGKAPQKIAVSTPAAAIQNKKTDSPAPAATPAGSQDNAASLPAARSKKGGHISANASNATGAGRRTKGHVPAAAQGAAAKGRPAGRRTAGSMNNDDAVNAASVNTDDNSAIAAPAKRSPKKNGTIRPEPVVNNTAVAAEPENAHNGTSQPVKARVAAKTKRAKKVSANSTFSSPAIAIATKRSPKATAGSKTNQSASAATPKRSQKASVNNAGNPPEIITASARTNKVTSGKISAPVVVAAPKRAKGTKANKPAHPPAVAAINKPAKKTKTEKMAAATAGKSLRTKSAATMKPAKAETAVARKMTEPKPLRNIRTSMPRPTERDGSALKPVKTAKNARLTSTTATKPARKRKNTTRPEPAIATVNKSTGRAFDNTLPPSLQGKNEDVRFPTAKPGSSNESSVAATATAPGAPDTTGNPVAAESDTTGDDTPYTMNKQRKNAKSGTEAGIAAGYSFGFAKPAPGEVVISPYIQVGLSDRLALRFSPAYRFGNVSTQPGAGGDYYRINSTSIQRIARFDSTLQDSVYTYNLSQNYDSLKVSSSFGGRTWAIDLPITLNYRLGAGFSAFGGPVLSYGGTISSVTSRQSFSVLRFDTIRNSLVLIDTLTLIAQFSHSGQPVSSAPADESFTGSNAFRIGYLAGLRYNYGRWQGELSLQQNVTGFSSITSEAVRKVYSQPYLRFTIGYSLWKPRQRNIQTEE